MNSTNKIDNESLLRRNAMVDHIFRECHDRLFRFVLGRFTRGDGALADEVVQEAFKRLLKQDVNAIRNPFAWLCDAAHNGWLDIRRRDAKSAEYTISLEDVEQVYPKLKNSWGAVRSEIERHEKAILLRQLIDHLPPKDQHVLQLHVEDRSIADIAYVLGRSPMAVKMQLFRIRRRLRRMYLASRRKR